MSDAALPHLSVEPAEEGGTTVLTLTGELDIGTVGQLESALAEATGDPPARLCLDLTPLDFIDSTGLAAIIRAHTAVTGAGGRLTVATGQGAVSRTFAITGLDGMITLCPGREEALRTLAG